MSAMESLRFCVEVQRKMDGRGEGGSEGGEDGKGSINKI